MHYGLGENSELFIIPDFLLQTFVIHYSSVSFFIIQYSASTFNSLGLILVDIVFIYLARMFYALLDHVTILYLPKYPELE